MPTFTTPSVEEGPAGRGPLFSRYRLNRGVTVLKNAGVYTEHRYPTHEQVVAADAAYIGGHTYTVSDDEADALIAAGYGGSITYEPIFATASTDTLNLIGQQLLTEITPAAISAVAETASLALVAQGAGAPPVVATAALTLTASTAQVDLGYPGYYGDDGSVTTTYPGYYGD